MSSPDGQIKINAPPELKAWFKRLAASNKRSLNGEILYRLEQARMKIDAPMEARQEHHAR